MVVALHSFDLHQRFGALRRLFGLDEVFGQILYFLRRFDLFICDNVSRFGVDHTAPTVGK